MTKRLQVAILYGGRSVEHEISIRSAKNVVDNIDTGLFEVFIIGIDKKGVWYLKEQVDSQIDQGRPISLRLDATATILHTSDGQFELGPDVVFPVLHGTDGEDGSIQGLFTAMDLPVVGSGVLGSAISMDKIVSKKILMASGVPVADYVEYSRYQKSEISFQKVVDAVGLPFMVKSASLGSSVGVTMVKSEADFENALSEGFKYDHQIIIEKYVKGRELECAVIGNSDIEASYPGEIVIMKDYDFYTYTAKYLDEKAIAIEVPAKLDGQIAEKIRKVSIQAYQALRCEDFARVDLFLTESGEVIVNEINTIPGFTSASMFPVMWQHMGLDYKTLISRLIQMCLKRYNDSKSSETHYNVVN
jgi:D-alanine-D-alanine ligase